jgi:hypothetical protein
MMLYIEAGIGRDWPGLVRSLMIVTVPVAVAMLLSPPHALVAEPGSEALWTLLCLQVLLHPP